MSAQQRRRDDEFGHLLTRAALAEYLGVSPNMVDSLIRYDGLGETSFTSAKGGHTFFMKQSVDQWELKKAGR
ncbi:hypothetical protein ABVF11_02170 [Pediococcus argentinicus]|uniref:hypothetical protein n=1 Tax=Pediococcus argentinicus TaxID=480391 RepID=UPI0033905875